MSNGKKLLDSMRANPKGDWTIEDVAVVCRYCGAELCSPRRGSHYTVRHHKCPEILPIPARKPLKIVYVKLFVSMMDSIKAEPEEGETQEDTPSPKG